MAPEAPTEQPAMPARIGARVRRVALWAAGLVALAAIGAWVVLWFALPDAADMCGNQIVAQYPSPSGTKRLVVFQRDCGATTGFSTQASLLRAGLELPDEGGNVFSADTDHGAAPSGRGGGPELGVAWRDEHALVLTRHPLARVFVARNDVDGVHVRYELKVPRPRLDVAGMSQ